MIWDEIALWGLTDESTETEVWEQAFQRLEGFDGRVSIATVSRGVPESRIISLQRMRDGKVYFMTSRGKPFYRQVKANPRISAAALAGDDRHSLRISAEALECTDPAIYREYADKNPGTMRMYRYNTALIALFCLERGYIELFHLYRDDKVRRLRVGFGGVTPPPLSYAITDACTGCGACFANCAEEAVVKLPDGKFAIRSMDCDDCGICYTKCPLAGKAMINRNDE